MLMVRMGIGIGHAVSLPALALVGLLVGCIAGMFGMGGGFLLTPALMYVFGVPAPIAVGSSLCQTCGTSLASFLTNGASLNAMPEVGNVTVLGTTSI